MTKDKKTLIIGTIGQDAHVIGAYVMTYALREAGFNVVNLGAMVSQKEFIDAAVETDADAILVSSLYGMGLMDCAGLREKCIEAILTATELSWEEINRRFKEMGFNRVYPPETLPETAIADLKEDFHL